MRVVQRSGRIRVVALAVAGLAAGVAAFAQAPPLDRLATLPGYERYARMQAELRRHAPSVGTPAVAWADDSRSVTYTWKHVEHRFDLTRMAGRVLGPAVGRGPAAPARRTDDEDADRARSIAPDPCPRLPLDRGRQTTCVPSPDRSMRAYYRDGNLYLSRADGTHEVAVSTGGGQDRRLKFGSASWVYGEELDQTTAIWWAPDGGRVAFYRFDESPVQDYYLQLDQTEVQDSLDVEAYPKAGTPNPIVDVLVYDLATGKTTRLDVRDGQAFTDEVVGHYVYNVTWAPDGSEVRLHRTDRRQQIMELAACSPHTAACRRIVREEWPTGWTENRPTMAPLADGQRFIWASDRTGWRNYYLYGFDGTLINAITALDGADAGPIVRVDEQHGALFYMARDGENFMMLQLHRVGLDGSDDRRLTDPRFTHTVMLAPDGRHFVDVFQTHDEPPAMQLVSVADGVVAPLAEGDRRRFDELGLRPVEHFTYLAADGQTTLFGSVAFPSDFDPARQYPVLIPVYAGPESARHTPSESFATPSPLTEFGFLVVTLGSRAMPGLGRRTLDAIHGKLGQTEVDDLAAGIRALAARPYVDAGRVGLYGTSYGGYVALLGLLRYPDLVAAASASSPVTDWRNYDTIYTERYMSLPADNHDGYERGSALRYAGALRGRLLLYFGTADNNVHPSNSLQLIAALNRAGKSYEVQVGPDAPHSAVPAGRMLEFLVENLIVSPERLRVE